MNTQTEPIYASDFTIDTFTNETVTLSAYLGEKNVVLVFNRGFM